MKKSRIKEDSWLLCKPIAHRGFHDKKSPENSLRAFENAKRMGYAIELDLHLTEDRNLIVFHDKNVKRMTGENIKTIDLTSEKLEELRLLDTDEKIPSFKEVIEIVAGKVPILIEIKNTSPVGEVEEKLLEELEDYKGEYILQAFNPQRIKWLKNNAPHVIRGQLSGRLKGSKMNKINRFMHMNLIFNFLTKPDFVNYEIKGLNSFVIKMLRRRGHPILSWTARSYDEYSKALNLSDNAVFENFVPDSKSIEDISTDAK